MNDYLSKLAARHRHEQPLVAPRLPSLFEPAQADTLPAVTTAEDDFDALREETVEFSDPPLPQALRPAEAPPARVEARIEPVSASPMPPNNQQQGTSQSKASADAPIEPPKARRRPRAALPEPGERRQVEDAEGEPLKPRQRSRSGATKPRESVSVPESEAQASTTRRTPGTVIPVEAAPVITPRRSAPMSSVEAPRGSQAIEPRQPERTQPVEPRAPTQVQTQMIERREREIVREVARGTIVPATQPSTALEPRLPAPPERPADAPRTVEPVIQVTIGRIEVRAGTPPPEEKPRTPRKSQTVGLDEYLRRRDGKGRP